ncbi:MAG: hypothetical protein IPO88_00005 [Nannocystis sp.]|nr:hypothetical protein [Nannocystis sp.]
MVGFKNLIDLRSILTRLLEMRSAEEMAALGRLKKPRARQELVRVDLDEAQRAKTGAHADAFAAKMATGGGNMALGLIVRLGLVAIHAQLDEGYSWDNALGGKDLPAPDSFRSPKFVAVAERILATPGCGHIVFLEPLAAQMWLREVLVEYGIPRARIALLNAQSAKSATDRVQLADDFNAGRYIVMIANSVGGEGANLQRRTCAVHNVDLPWGSHAPAAAQRPGRSPWQRARRDRHLRLPRAQLRRRPALRQDPGQGTWIDQVMESEDDIVSNPSAMVEFPPIELIADLTTDPEKTRALLEQVARQEVAARRGKLLRQVARLMRSADARFRAAERAAEPLEAARLRQEGQAELANLRNVDASPDRGAPLRPCSVDHGRPRRPRADRADPRELHRRLARRRRHHASRHRPSARDDGPPGCVGRPRPHVGQRALPGRVLAPHRRRRTRPPRATDMVEQRRAVPGAGQHRRPVPRQHTQPRRHAPVLARCRRLRRVHAARHRERVHGVRTASRRPPVVGAPSARRFPDRDREHQPSDAHPGPRLPRGRSPARSPGSVLGPDPRSHRRPTRRALHRGSRAQRPRLSCARPALAGHRSSLHRDPRRDAAHHRVRTALGQSGTDHRRRGKPTPTCDGQPSAIERDLTASTK